MPMVDISRLTSMELSGTRAVEQSRPQMVPVRPDPEVMPTVGARAFLVENHCDECVLFLADCATAALVI